MPRRATFKQADLTRALRGVKAAGMDPRGCRINPVTGEIEVHFGKPGAEKGNTFDALREASR